MRVLLNSESDQSDLEQSGTCFAVIRCLYGLADECRTALGAERLQNILRIQDGQHFLDAVEPVINELSGLACQDTDDADARRIIDFIDQNLGNYALSREWVAENCGMTEYTLSRIFRKTIKKSYTDYIRIQHLNKAKELLRQSDMTVNDIGNSLGYTNISYFIRAFKEYVGTTPALYRMECRSIT